MPIKVSGSGGAPEGSQGLHSSRDPQAAPPKSRCHLLVHARPKHEALVQGANSCASTAVGLAGTLPAGQLPSRANHQQESRPKPHLPLPKDKTASKTRPLQRSFLREATRKSFFTIRSSQSRKRSRAVPNRLLGLGCTCTLSDAVTAGCSDNMHGALLRRVAGSLLNAK